MRAVRRSLAVGASHLSQGRRCAILCYHSIDEPDLGPDVYSVGVDTFRSTLKTLWEHGYGTVSLKDFAAPGEADVEFPRKSCLISFDDCYESAYTLALPALQEFGFTATFFVATDYVDGSDVREFRGRRLERPYIRWDQLRRLVSRGMEIGSHTCTHRKMTELAPDRVEWELVKSREVLEDKLGIPIEVFAYPGGRFNEKIAQAVESAGYLAATTTRSGINTDRTNRFLLKRYEASGRRLLGRELMDVATGVHSYEDSINRSWPVQQLRSTFYSIRQGQLSG